MRQEIAILFAVTAVAAGCRTAPEAPPPSGPAPPVSAPSVLCQDPLLADDDFCMPVARIEALLRSGRDRVVEVRVTKSGFSRPRRLLVAVDDEDGGDPLVFKVKWKPAPPGGKGFNNVPGREIASYAVQPLFLDFSEYVVPPTMARCVDEDVHAQTIGREAATFEGTRCVFGLLAYWVENVTPDGARDFERFETDAAYRRQLAHLNLLTHLVDHRDSRAANFLVAKDPSRPRVFAIDNGLAFGGFMNPFTYGPFMKNWGKLLVSRLPRDSVDRLRAVTRADLDKLAVVAQFEDRDGLLVETLPTEPLDPTAEVRMQGVILQLGLTRKQIDAMQERIRELLERVDAGEIDLF